MTVTESAISRSERAGANTDENISVLDGLARVSLSDSHSNSNPESSGCWVNGSRTCGRGGMHRAVFDHGKARVDV
jgi:hypothetical protein